LKHIVSVSLGSSRRDKSVTQEFLGEKFLIERIGVNGDTKAYTKKMIELDGQVDVFGLGGADFYVYAGDKQYTFKGIAKMVEPVKRTPIVDGSGLKNTLERETVQYLANEWLIDFAHSKTLLVSGVDRFGMAEALAETGGSVVYGDILFGLGLNIPLKSFAALKRAAGIVLPILVKLPLDWFYPTGEKQNVITPKWQSYYQWADIIAGDFLLIKRYMPEQLEGKIILTNTTTDDDAKELAKRGVKQLITTTPEFSGRSFGTNVMEAVLVALSGKAPKDLTPSDYLDLLKQLNWKPRIQNL
jgi:hypothetical protein